MDMRTPPLKIKILLVSNPPKSRVLVQRFAVFAHKHNKHNSNHENDDSNSSNSVSIVTYPGARRADAPAAASECGGGESPGELRT